MNDLKLAREIIKSVISSTELPVSIKTRSKVGEVDVLRFLDNINDLDIKAIMIHGRTLAQGFSGPVDWEIIRKAKDYFNGIILANGGIYSYDDAVKALDQAQAHGLGLARGALGRPWIFRSLKAQKNYEDAEKKEKIFKIAYKHAKLVEKLKGEQGIIEMRKHLCWYVQGLPGARKLRQRLVKAKNLEEIKKILRP
jgi:tRNA-dihydrouridine synthase